MAPLLESEDEVKAQLQTLKWGLASSSSFLLGAIIFAPWTWVEANSRDQDHRISVTQLLAVFGFLFIGISVSIEVWIDRKLNRPLEHGRYYARNSTPLNLFLSTLILSATLLQGIYHVARFSNVGYHNVTPLTIVNLVAGVLWLSSGLVMVGHCCSCIRGDGICSQKGLDGLGNTLYILSTVLLFVAGIDLYHYPNEFLGQALQELVSLLFVLFGFLYVAADVWRLRSDPKTLKNDPIDVETTA